MTPSSLPVGPTTYGGAGFAYFGRYASGDIAIWVADANGEPQCKATVYIEGMPPPDDCVWIKTWSENDGVLDALEKAGVVVRLRRSHQVSEHAVAQLAQLTPAARDEMLRQREA